MRYPVGAIMVDMPAEEVHNTGLIAPNGQHIIKVIPREPIGFVHFPEQEEYESEKVQKSPR